MTEAFIIPIMVAIPDGNQQRTGVSQISKLQSAKVRDQVMTGYQDNGSAIYLGTAGWDCGRR